MKTHTSRSENLSGASNLCSPKSMISTHQRGCRSGLSVRGLELWRLFSLLGAPDFRLLVFLAFLSLRIEAAAQTLRPAAAMLCCTQAAVGPAGSFVTRLIRLPPSPSDKEVQVQLQATTATGTLLPEFTVSIPAGEVEMWFTNGHPALAEGGKLSLLNPPAFVPWGSTVTELVVAPRTVALCCTQATVRPDGSFVTRLIRLPPSPSDKEIQAHLQAMTATGTLLPEFTVSIPAGATEITFTNGHPALADGGKLRLINPTAFLPWGSSVTELVVAPRMVALCCSQAAVGPDGSFVTRLIRLPPSPSDKEVQVHLQAMTATGTVLPAFTVSIPAGATQITFTNGHPALALGGKLTLLNPTGVAPWGSTELVATPRTVALCCTQAAVGPDGSFVTRLIRVPPTPSDKEIQVQLQATTATGTLLPEFTVSIPAGATEITFTNGHPALALGGKLMLLNPTGVAPWGSTELVAPLTVSFDSTNVTIGPEGGITLNVRISRVPSERRRVIIRQISGERRDDYGVTLPPFKRELWFGPGELAAQEVPLGAAASSDSSFVLESSTVRIGSNSVAWAKVGTPEIRLVQPVSSASPGGVAAVELERTDRFLGKSVEIHWRAENGSAQSGQDYSITNGVVTFGPEERQQRILLPILPAATQGRSFAVRFSSADARFPDGALATVEIRPTVTLTSSRIDLDPSGNGEVGFRISEPAKTDVSISLAAGIFSLQGVIPAGRTEGSLMLRTLNMVTPGKLTLSHVSGPGQIRYYVGYPASAEVFPASFKSEHPEILASAASTYPGQPVIFRLTRKGDLSRELVISFATVNGTANAGEDFTHREAPVRFALGVSQMYIRIETHHDQGTPEAAETFSLALTSPDPQVRFVGEAIGKIEPYPYEVAAPPPRVVMEAGELTLYAGDVAGGAHFFTADGSAEAVVDCDPSSDVFDCLLRIRVLDDGYVEPPKTGFLHLVTSSQPAQTNMVEVLVLDNEVPDVVDWETTIPEAAGYYFALPTGLVRRDDSIVLVLIEDYAKPMLGFFDRNGVRQRTQALPEPLAGLVELANGDLLLLFQQRIEHLKPDGTREPFPLELPMGEISARATTRDGHVLLAITTPFAGPQLVRFTEDGRWDSLFRSTASFPYSRIDHISPLPDGSIDLTGATCWKFGCNRGLVRYQNGEIVRVQETGWHSNPPLGEGLAFGHDRQGRFLRPIVWNTDTTKSVFWVRRHLDGTLDRSFNSGPLPPELQYVGTQSDGAIIAYDPELIARRQGFGAGLLRLSGTGREVPNRFRFENPRAHGENSTNIVIQITRTGSTIAPASVRVQTADGTALAGLDYEAVDTRVHFGPFEVTKTMLIPLRQDLRSEEYEFVRLRLSEPSAGAEIPQPETSFWISDDDPFVRLEVERASAGGQKLRIINPAWVRVEVQSSDDLVRWTPITVSSNSEMEMPLPAEGASRFYRTVFRTP